MVKVPDDVRAALRANPDAAAFFDELSYSHRREYVDWIEEAKREDTRQRRIQKMIGDAASGQEVAMSSESAMKGTEWRIVCIDFILLGAVLAAQQLDVL